MSLAVFVLTHLAFASLLAVVAVAVGRRLVALAGPAAPALPAPPAAPAVIGARGGLPLAAGLGSIGCALALLAAAGRLTTSGVVLVLAAAAGAAAPEWRPLLAEVAGTVGAVARVEITGAARRPRRWPWAAAAVLAAAPVLALALYPPTGFDALLYHLPAAARFAASGRIEVAPELRFPAFPWLNEILFAAALLLQDDVAAQLVECLAFLGVAALLWEMGRRRGGPWAGALGAALWLGSPLAAWAAASAYVEPLEALFVLAAVEASLLAAERPAVDGGAAGRSEGPEKAPEPRALALAGALAGCAAAVKYQGLFAVALVAVLAALAVGPLRGGGVPDEPAFWRRRLLAPLVVLAGAAAVALPWYVWIGAATGDPLFPTLTRLTHPRAAGVPGLENWRSLPWRLLVQKIWPYPPGSPWLWLLAPLPVLARRRFPQAARLGIAGLALALATAAVHPDGRMIAVAGPLFCAGIAAVVVLRSQARWGAAGAAPRLLAITLLALLPGWCYTALLAARRGAIPSDGASRESYLRRRLPAYGALSWLNSAHGRQYAVYGLWAENLRYYAAGRFIGDWYGAWPFAAALHAAERPAELRAFLLRAGADHLLVRRQPGKPDLLPCGDARFAPFLRAEHCDGEASVWAVATPPRRGGS